MKAVDLFAGAGGWDVAARDQGIEVVGIELDRYATETRLAAGLATVQGDVRDYGPSNFSDASLLIASPPCQPFSSAGTGAGRKSLDLVFSLIEQIANNNLIDYSGFDDERIALVTEPFRWVMEAIEIGHPFRMLAWEQVPSVLPVWQAVSEYLRESGYSAITGVLSAEQYGVAQTRKRAFLLASLEGEVSLPAPLHRKFRRSVSQTEGDLGLLPWVSMKEALPRVHADIEDWFLKSSFRGKGHIEGYGDRHNRQHFEPSKTITTSSGRWHFQCSIRKNATYRYPDMPAPTLTAGKDWGTTGWYLQNGTLIRKIDVSEASLLQSFPEDYPWKGPKSSVFRQIGNAVPPKLAFEVLVMIAAER